MTLHNFLRVAGKRWRVVLAGLLAGVFATAVLTWTTPREYSAQVTIYVSAQTGSDGAAAAYQGNLLSEQKVKSYTRLLTSNRVAQDVVDRLGLDVPASQVAGALKASAQPDTVLLAASATDQSPQRAKEIADATGEAFTRLVSELEQPSPGATAAVTARVVEPALLPTSPVTPKPMVNLALGVLLGLVAGCALALLREALDTTVKTVEDLRRLTGSPNLGTVALDPDVPRHPLTVQQFPHSPKAEAFRKIRTNLQFIDVDRPRKAIVVTSALPEEGKTTTLCNIAVVLARAGHRVVLVEADLRRPRAADYLGLENAVGVTSVLAGRVSLEQALQPWGEETFDVLASGPIPPNPSELLSSQQMENLVTELRERYDMVLLDAPPLLPVTDAAALGTICDGALLAVRYGKTTASQVRAAMGALEAVSVRVLGSVFTMVPDSGSNAYYEYYSAEDEAGLTAPLAAVPSAPKHDPRRNGDGKLAGRLPVDTLVPGRVRR